MAVSRYSVTTFSHNYSPHTNASLRRVFPRVQTVSYLTFSTALTKGSQSPKVYDGENQTSDHNCFLQWLQSHYNLVHFFWRPLKPCRGAFQGPLPLTLGTTGFHNVNQPSAITLKQSFPIPLSNDSGRGGGNSCTLSLEIWILGFSLCFGHMTLSFDFLTALPLAGTSCPVTGLLPRQGHLSELWPLTLKH